MNFHQKQSTFPRYLIQPIPDRGFLSKFRRKQHFSWVESDQNWKSCNFLIEVFSSTFLESIICPGHIPIKIEYAVIS